MPNFMCENGRQFLIVRQVYQCGRYINVAAWRGKGIEFFVTHDVKLVIKVRAPARARNTLTYSIDTCLTFTGDLEFFRCFSVYLVA